MREYLYCWTDPRERFLVASGLHFRDLAKPLAAKRRGVVLLRHDYSEARTDDRSSFDYVPAGGLARLAALNIYDWGDCVWADFPGARPGALTKRAVADLLYFGHRGEPIGGCSIPSLKNRFLCHGHDDGWYLRLYYVAWRDVAEILTPAILALAGPTNLPALLSAIRLGSSGFWFSGQQTRRCPKTHDIDRVLAGRRPK